MTKSIILLSGGLDSLVSLGLKKDELNIDLAITFDYGQKSVAKEVLASKTICDYYKISHKIIKLDWLKEITQTSLVSDEKIPTQNDLTMDEKSAKSVWVPNRNGLFLNIAASYADSFGYDYIIMGANKEEGATFPDNTSEFVQRVEAEFEYSTLKRPKILRPLINMDKIEIVHEALKLNAPLDLIHSCYLGSEKHCGKCESCMHLLKALQKNNAKDFIKKLF